jgi:MFS transporter, PAT family, beta-lactamase induction signal transducer AmpG
VTAFGERMVPPTSISRQARVAKARWGEALGVYLRGRVLIVLFLGFSAGLPRALSASTLLLWMREVGVDLGTIGLFALVGMPYALKFLWAPLVDALDVPVLSRALGRRRGWLVLTQVLLMAAVSFLAFCDPAINPWKVAFGALLVAVASATQDIVIDTFRVESLEESEQAAGMAAYVAAYRIGTLVSTAGALYLVSGLESFGFAARDAWIGGYLAMAALVTLGIITTLVATEPGKSATADQMHAGQKASQRLATTVIGAFLDFFCREGIPAALVVLAFVILFKFTDALAGAMTAPFVIDLGFSRDVYATIIKGVGLIATLAGGFAGGFVVKSCPLAASMWIGGVIQALANLAFSWLAIVGANIGWLAFAIVAENFTAGIGTVIFVAYLSALCRNPLHTATQYALLTALAAFGPTFLSSGAGFIADRTGWALFFAVCAAAALPSFVLLSLLQRWGHFSSLTAKPVQEGG